MSSPKVIAEIALAQMMACTLQMAPAGTKPCRDDARCLQAALDWATWALTTIAKLDGRFGPRAVLL